VYSAHGQVTQVLQLKPDPLPLHPPKPQQVALRMLASPINPADLNQVEGVYARLARLPAVGGNEGVAQVIESSSDMFREGEWVIPAFPGAFGTWRQSLVVDASQVIAIRQDIPVEEAACISVNPCTAFRMIQDFAVPAREQTGSDVIVQNAANSGVGIAVIQLAKILGFKTFNVIRDREDFDAVAAQLEELGADFVVSESQLTDRQSTLDSIKFLEKNPPAIALNAVGGNSASNLFRLLR